MDQQMMSRGDAQQSQEEQRIKQSDDSRRSNFHVLAVDDSVSERKILEKLLTLSSYQVTCVDSGDKALEYLGLLNNLSSIDDTSAAPCSSFRSSSSSPESQSNSISHQSVSPQDREVMKVNLIMTDYCMPGMTGYDLLRRVKGSSWKDIPVVVMSSENVPSRISMCLEGGAEKFLLKPVQLSDVKKLQNHLLQPLNGSSDAIDGNNTAAAAANIGNGPNDDGDSSMGINCASKRKAMSPEASERRPKPKGLAVV